MRNFYISFAAIILLCIFSIVAKGADDKSLVLYLMFEEGGGDTTADTSNYGNNGIIKGNPEWVAGKFGTALQLDGVGDTVEIPHHESLNMTTAVTMEMWLKVAAAGGNANQAGIEKGGWEVGEYSLYAVYTNNTLAQFNDLPEGCDDEKIGPSIRNEKWRHLAGVWDGTDISLYIDGEVVISGECEGELGTNAKSVYIGSRNGNDRFLIAAVDEVRVYNRALTQEEIQLDMETSDSLSVSPSEKMAISWGKVKQGY